MAYSQTDLDTINAALASGKRRLRIDNREVEYHSISQLLKVKEDIQNELAIEATQTGARPMADRISSDNAF